MDYTLSKPATLAAISYMIMSLAILLPFNVTSTDPILGQSLQNYDFGRKLLVVIIMLIPMGLSIYSINCMMMGKCFVWSWVNAIAIAGWVILFLIASVLSFDSRNQSATITVI